MDTPLNELVATIVDLLDVDLREAYEERAGIMQFSAHLSKEQAEAKALLDVLHLHPTVLTVLTAIKHDNEMEASNGAKKYFGKLYERNGEFEYRHPVLFESTDIDPMPELTRMAREFYPDVADEQDEGFYFFCGGICVKPESVVEVTEEEYAVLKQFI